jgi:hypothetical protein
MDRGGYILHATTSAKASLLESLLPAASRSSGDESPLESSPSPSIVFVANPATAPAALRGYSDCTSRFMMAGVALLLLSIFAARVSSAFGSRDSEDAVIDDFLHDIPRTNFVADETASAVLAYVYCIVMGLMNGLSEVDKVYQYLRADSSNKASDAGLPDRSHSCFSSGCLCLRRFALPLLNASITAFTTANGVLLFGGEDPNIGFYIAAALVGLIVFGSSSFFNMCKQSEAKEVELSGAKQILFPVMVVAALITNGSTAVYQSLLLLSFFDTEMNVAIPLSIALAIVSDLNLYFAQVPAMKTRLANMGKAQKNDSQWVAKYLVATPVIALATLLTPFNTPQGLKDTLQVFTVCADKIGHQPSNTWYDTPAGYWSIGGVGFVLGLNVAFSLWAFRGTEVTDLVCRLFSVCQRSRPSVSEPSEERPLSSGPSSSPQSSGDVAQRPEYPFLDASSPSHSIAIVPLELPRAPLVDAAPGSEYP